MLYRIENRNEPISTVTFNSLSIIPHIHSHLELIYLTEGSSIATLDKEEYIIEKGDLFLAFPNQIHCYHDQSTVKGFCFIFSPDLFKDFRDIFQSSIPLFPIIKQAQLPSNLRSRLKKITSKNVSNTSFDRIAAKGELLSLLAELLPKMTLINTPIAHDSVKRILTYCSENYTNASTLEHISKELFLSKHYISHIFNDRLHISFTDFINSLRVEHACSQLEQGVNITDVALSSGFTSVRNFNRVFIKSKNLTPREYIKRKEGSDLAKSVK